MVYLEGGVSLSHANGQQRRKSGPAENRWGMSLPVPMKVMLELILINFDLYECLIKNYELYYCTNCIYKDILKIFTFHFSQENRSTICDLILFYVLYCTWQKMAIKNSKSSFCALMDIFCPLFTKRVMGKQILNPSVKCYACVRRL